ncbi:MAG: adenosine kinase [Hyphomicrobiales bacterium]|nr:adenosine kinase [Hyphomicrobiales bacterium]PCJ87317.1 MAG: adenosine kinase [Hyphomicrobiales bacterium]
MTDTFDYHVLGIGNAIVDVLSQTDDDFLVAEGLAKGSMNLINAARAEALYAAMGPAIEASGGSAGNTIAAVGNLGGRGAFFGKVCDDTLGQFYRHDMRAQNITFDTVPLKKGESPTARSMILITPDGERTMNTNLSACVELGPDDIDENIVAGSAISYFEGYLWDPPLAKDAFRKAADIGHAHNRKVSITLSDSFCVDRWRDEFMTLIKNGTVDILLANDAEIKALYQTADLDTALKAIQQDCALTAVTHGVEGCFVIDKDGVLAVPTTPVTNLIDTTGAGDMFAAGFLYGHAKGLSNEVSANLGNLAAGEVLGHIGPRPQRSLQQLAEQKGLL